MTKTAKIATSILLSAVLAISMLGMAVPQALASPDDSTGSTTLKLSERSFNNKDIYGVSSDGYVFFGDYKLNDFWDVNGLNYYFSNEIVGNVANASSYFLSQSGLQTFKSDHPAVSWDTSETPSPSDSPSHVFPDGSVATFIYDGDSIKGILLKKEGETDKEVLFSSPIKGSGDFVGDVIRVWDGTSTAPDFSGNSYYVIDGSALKEMTVWKGLGLYSFGNYVYEAIENAGETTLGFWDLDGNVPSENGTIVCKGTKQDVSISYFGNKATMCVVATDGKICLYDSSLKLFYQGNAELSDLDGASVRSLSDTLDVVTENGGNNGEAYYFVASDGTKTSATEALSVESGSWCYFGTVDGADPTLLYANTSKGESRTLVVFEPNLHVKSSWRYSDDGIYPGDGFSAYLRKSSIFDGYEVYRTSGDPLLFLDSSFKWRSDILQITYLDDGVFNFLLKDEKGDYYTATLDKDLKPVSLSGTDYFLGSSKDENLFAGFSNVLHRTLSDKRTITYVHDKDGKVGAVDADGKVVIPVEYDAYFDGGDKTTPYILLKKDGAWHFATLDGSDPSPATCESHSWSADPVVVNPTCTEDGSKVYTCTKCGFTKTEILKKLGHDWGEPVWKWDDDFANASIDVVCKRDSSHVISKTVKAEESKVSTGTKKTVSASMDGDNFVDAVIVGEGTISGTGKKVPFVTRGSGVAKGFEAQAVNLPECEKAELYSEEVTSGSVYDALMSTINNGTKGEVAGVFKVELLIDGTQKVHKDFGSLDLTFPTRAALAGRNVVVYHCHADNTSNISSTKLTADDDGRVTVKGVTDLSTFALEALKATDSSSSSSSKSSAASNATSNGTSVGSNANSTDLAKTGDTTAAKVAFIVLLAIAAASIAFVAVRYRRRA